MRRTALITHILEAGFILALLFLGPALAQGPMMADETGATLSSAAKTEPEPAPAGSRPAPTSQIREADPGPPVLSLRWFWTLGNKGDGPSPLLRATIAALALLIAFLTVVQLWQVPPPSTSLTSAVKPAKEREGTGSRTEPSVTAPVPGRVGNIFDSNFSRIVLSGLGGLAAVTLIGDEPRGFKESYYFILFVVFFVIGLVVSALIRGVGEAVRSRIVLSRPRAAWPRIEQEEDFGRARRSYWGRRFWYWLTSFRATLVVFIDTAFNVLTGRNQLQSALFSETITDLHEALLEAAERTREEVHRAVIRALDRKHVLPADLPHEEEVRVAVSLLSEDGSSVYYIAWEHGSLPSSFDDHTVAWVTATSGKARWCKEDLAASGTKKWNLIYLKNPDPVALDEQSVGGKVAPLLLKSFYRPRAGEDYGGFIVLPMPWTNRGETGSHRRGCLHISFKKAEYMDQLWENLEQYPVPGKVVPNYDQWRGLLDPSDSGKPDRAISLIADDVLRRTAETTPTPSPGTALAERRVQTQVLAVRSEAALIEVTAEEAGAVKERAPKPVAILDAELGAVLHQALEVLGHALSHFDDEVYDVYVRSRRPSAEIPR